MSSMESSPRCRFLLAILFAFLGLTPGLGNASALRVRFIDVGQGDAILIRLPSGDGWLVDGGPQSQAVTTALIAGLREEGLERLAGLVITHPHLDHFGGFIGLIEKFPVGMVVRGIDVPAPTYQRFISRAGQLGIPVTRSPTGAWPWDSTGSMELLHSPSQQEFDDEFQALLARSAIPGALVAEILCESCGEEPGSSTFDLDLNDYSLVIRVRSAGTSTLLTGDATARVEQRILASGTDPAAAVLKVGHHGSRTSSTAGFLSRVAPQEAIISSGRGNSFGHPHPEALTRLSSQGVHIWRTDQTGSLLLDVTGAGHSEVRPAGALAITP